MEYADAEKQTADEVRFCHLLSLTELFNGIAYQLKQLLHAQNSITFVAAHLFCKLARTVVSLVMLVSFWGYLIDS